METTNTLIEKLRATTKTKSDYAVAKLLGCTQSTLINWKSGKTSMASAYAVKAAEILEMDPMQVIAWLELERGPLPKHKHLWERYAGRLLPSVIFATMIGFGGFKVEAATVSQVANSFLHTSDYVQQSYALSGSLDIHYAHKRKTGFWQKVRSWLSKSLNSLKREASVPGLLLGAAAG